MGAIKNGVKNDLERFLKYKYKLLLELGIKTGLRISDLLALKTAQIYQGRFLYY